MITNLSSHIKKELIAKKIWKPGCPINIEDLRIVNISYINFEGIIKNDGEIMVDKSLTDNVIKIFSTLKEIQFPISKIRLIQHYNGDDDLSMQDNNSSAFNHRFIEGTTKLSTHSYGRAIDINPKQNPMIIGEKVFPECGRSFLDRSYTKPGMITDTIVKLFNDNGFTIWGGKWNDIKDYHHFESPI